MFSHPLWDNIEIIKCGKYLCSVEYAEEQSEHSGIKKDVEDRVVMQLLLLKWFLSAVAVQFAIMRIFNSALEKGFNMDYLVNYWWWVPMKITF